MFRFVFQNDNFPHRYITAYLIELVENSALLTAAFFYKKDGAIIVVALFSGVSFILAIAIMLIYYQLCHPTLGDKRACYRFT